MIRRVAVIVVAMALIVAACGDDGTAPTAPTTVDATGGTGDEPAGEDPQAGPSGPPLFEGLGGTVTLITDEAGGGIRPLLEWESVVGADHYTAYLYAPSGAVYWTWTGHRTEVHVGGEPRLRDGASGPSIVEGMTWAVMAHDSSGLPLAVSEQRPISP